MNQSGKSYGAAALRGLYVLLCSAMIIAIVGAHAQAQTLLTRHAPLRP